MNKTLIGFIAFSVIILSVLPLANADEHPATLNSIEIHEYRELTAEVQIYYEIWEIPIEFPVGKQECETFYDGPRILKQCFWEAIETTEEFEREWTYDPDTDKMRPTVEVEAEAIADCEADESCPLGIYTPEQTKWEEELDKIEEDEDNYSKDELIRLINEMLENPSQCQQGIGTTAGSQTYRSFEIPTYEYTDADGNTRLILDTRTEITDRNLRGILGNIVQDARECFAQMVLLDTQGGIMSQADANFAFCDSNGLNTSAEYDYKCGKSYLDHSAVASNVPEWSQERVNQEANADGNPNEWSIEKDVCNGFYTNSWKMTFKECQPNYTDSELGKASKQPTMKDYHDSEVGQEYEQYLEDGGNAMMEDLRKQTIQDKIAQLNAQLRTLKDQ